MAALRSISFDNIAVFTAQLDRHGDGRAVAIAPEPAMITGEWRFDNALAFGLSGATFVIDGLAATVGMQIKIDPSTSRGLRIGDRIARLHRHLDLGRVAGFQNEDDFILPRFLCMGGTDKNAEHAVQQTG